MGRPITWTDQMDEVLLAMLGERASFTTIGERLGMGQHGARRRARLINHATRYPKGRKPAEIDLQEAVRLYHTGMSPRAAARAMPPGQNSARVEHLLRGMIEAGELVKHPGRYERLGTCKTDGCTARAVGLAHGLCARCRMIRDAGPCPYTPERLAEIYAAHPTVAAAAAAMGHPREVMRHWLKAGGVVFRVPQQEQREDADRKALAAIKAEDARRRKLLLRQLPACEVEAMNRLHAERVLRAMGVAA